MTHDLPVFAHGVGALIQKVFEGSRSWANIRSEDYHIRHKSSGSQPADKLPFF